MNYLKRGVIVVAALTITGLAAVGMAVLLQDTVLAVAILSILGMALLGVFGWIMFVLGTFYHERSVRTGADIAIQYRKADAAPTAAMLGDITRAFAEGVRVQRTTQAPSSELAQLVPPEDGSWLPALAAGGLVVDQEPDE